MKIENIYTGKFFEVCVPARSRIALKIGDKESSKIVAYFTNEMQAEAFKEFLKSFLKDLECL